MKHIAHSFHRNAATALSTFILLLLFSACKKDNDDNGTNTVEITDVATSGNLKLVPVEYGTGSLAVTAITLKNNATGSAGSVIVKLALDDAAVTATNLKLLAPSRYTLSTLEYVVPANSTVNVPVIVNRSNLSVDTAYGIGFKIDQVNAGTVSGGGQKIVVKLDMRNKYDGRYKVTGTFVDYAAPTITFTEFEAIMSTTGAAQIGMVPKDLGIPGYLILSGTSLSYYGSFGPLFNFNPATNKITSVVNSYGQPASNTRAAELDPSGTNQWDPMTKAITVKFWMNQSNTVTTPPHHRVLFTNTLVYLGPRF